MEFLPLRIKKAAPAYRADVVVCGGGPAGVAAAVSAARSGAEVVLIERYGFLGGMATAGLVNPFMSFFAGEKQTSQGSFSELLDRLASYRTGLGTHKLKYAFDPDVYTRVAEEMCLEAGVKPVYHSFVMDAVVEGERAKAAITASKSGVRAILGTVFVDATGDADFAALAGCPFEEGRPEDGLTQPMTLCFRMNNVDEDRMPSREEISEAFKAARARGEISIPLDWGLLWFHTTRKGEIHFNNTRIAEKLGTDTEDLTAAEIEGRRQAFELSEWLIANIPGFEQATISRLACQVGVRETRRILGDYVMDEDDILAARKFEDAVACGVYGIDIHDPKGGGATLKQPPAGDFYQIPYRSLTAKGLDNLLVAGRPISATHEAHSALRVMPIAAALGDAAGVAAALAAKQEGEVRQVKVPELQAQLRALGAFLG